MPRKPKSKNMPEATVKGRLVEQIVAALHKYPDCKVETNVRLPALDSEFPRTREVDVLITGGFEDQPVQLAIECKNYKQVIGAEKVGAFIDKLTDIGIPHNQGVYVTANRFSRDAIDRARKAGLKLFIIKGLTPDRMASLLHQAVYSVVYLVANLIKMRIVSDDPEYTMRAAFHVLNTPIFFNSEGIYISSMATEAWLLWQRQGGNWTIGAHTFSVQPEDLYTKTPDRLEKVLSLEFEFGVVGLVADFLGTATQHTLIQTPTNTPERSRTDVKFHLTSGTMKLKEFRTEDEFNGYAHSIPVIARVTERILNPRIWQDCIYWPPSDKALNELDNRVALYALGHCSSLQPEDVTAIEGSSLNTAWEPVSKRFAGMDPATTVR